MLSACCLLRVSCSTFARSYPDASSYIACNAPFISEGAADRSTRQMTCSICSMSCIIVLGKGVALRDEKQDLKLAFPSVSLFKISCFHLAPSKLETFAQMTIAGCCVIHRSTRSARRKGSSCLAKLPYDGDEFCGQTRQLAPILLAQDFGGNQARTDAEGNASGCQKFPRVLQGHIAGGDDF
jgi:hypothetical protein